MDMTLDVTQVLVGYDGEALMDTKPILDGEGKQVLDDKGVPEFEKVPITLRPICINALMAVMEADKGMTGEDKVKNWCLAGKIQKEDAVELLAEDVTLLKKRIGASYGPAIVGPAFLLLNGTPATPPPAPKDQMTPYDHPSYAGVRKLAEAKK
jgi:hypothetical protein